MLRRPPAHLTRLLLAAALLAGTVQALRAQDEPGVDPGVAPGDDFFAYANGAWLKANDIPPGRARWDARSEIGETTRQRVQALVQAAVAAPAGTPARQVADFHSAYLDEAAIEAKGLAPLQPLLAGIDQLRSKTGLARWLGSTLPADVDPLNLGVYDSAHVLGLAVQASNHGEKENVAFLLQGGLGLPSREHYLSAEPGMQALRAQYQAYAAQVLARLGHGDTGRRAAAVVALETALAQSHAPPEVSGNDRNADQVWTRADFARLAPGMDWPAFFAAAGLARQPAVVAWQPGAVKGLAALVASRPLQAWQDYLRVRLVHTHADVLPRAFAEAAPALRGAPPPRAQRALDATQAALADALGPMYAERYFPPEHKAKVQAIAANVIAAFTQRVEAVTWLSSASKAVAVAKLKTVYFGLGYPERWRDLSGLAVDPADALGNLLRVAEWNRREALARLGRPVDRTAWVVPPQWPGAVLLFHQNSYNFAAALLQPPKFDPAASDAANYGAIGAIVGHELSHFVDTLGADYEADGRMRRWWTADDLGRYEAAVDPLVAQYAGYRPFPDLAVNGRLTLTENLADLGGLAAAFDAYRRALGGQASDPATVRQQDRQFFIGFARAWRGKARDEAVRAQIASDGHALERYRIATVRNLDAWYEAFDVRPGQRLYLDPRARVRVW